jgi:predicted O-methyltransferase YrrM
MSLSLPEFPNRVSEFVNGRNPYEGYQRGWGLQFGDLRENILTDPLYQRASQLAHGRSVVAEDRRMNMFLIIRFYLERLACRDIIEFGSWRGGNALFMAACLKELHPGALVYALDTFEGMPETDPVIDLHREGDFADANFPELEAVAREHGLDNLRFVKGRFEDTAMAVYEAAGGFGLAHIDCDIYSAVKFAQDTVLTHMCRGGYLVYDDACVSSCLGATQAVEEFVMTQRIHSEQIWPQFVFRRPF